VRPRRRSIIGFLTDIPASNPPRQSIYSKSSVSNFTIPTPPPYGKSPYVLLSLLQNLNLLFSPSFLGTSGPSTSLSGGPEFLKKSARSLVAEPPLLSSTAGDLACNLAFPLDATLIAPNWEFARDVVDDEDEEFAARAFAAASVLAERRKGCGEDVEGGGMSFRKSIRDSWRGAGAGGACAAECGSAVNWSSSSSSSSSLTSMA
jgi:hypothetical protein